MSAPLVVDASVATAIVLEERASDTIKSLLSDGERWSVLIGPSILASETAAAITKKLRRREIAILTAQAVFAVWRGMVSHQVFELTPANDLLDEAFDLSLKQPHPLHDCLYLALALKHNATIATRDSVFARKAQEIGVPVELIVA